MDKILILTNDQDIHTDLVLRAIQRKGGRVLRFHPGEYPVKSNISYESGKVHIHDLLHLLKYDLSEIGSVWYRRPKHCKEQETINDPTMRLFASEEAQHFIENLYMLMEDVLWVNPYFANIRARYKLLQRREAQLVGLAMPDTIVTNEPCVASSFIERHKGNVVYKCVRTGVVNKEDGSNDVIFTNKISKDDIDAIEQVRLAPCVFQEYIEKQLELRVTIVGTQVFSCAIYSQEKTETSIDWRQGLPRHEPFTLPREIESKLIYLMSRYKLQYGAFDLVLTPDNEFVMLELNPNGQWAFIQGLTGLPIAEALADLLMRKEP